MAEIVVMPKIGLTATEAELSGWLVEIGQEVSTGDLICEIETDKITNEIEAPASGTLLKRVEARVSVPVGEPIAVLGSSEEDVSAIRLYEPREESVDTSEGRGDEDAAPSEAEGEERRFVRSSPAARRRAKELGLSLDEISGTGPGGRVTLEDVESASESTGGTYLEPSPLRRAIAKSMIASASVPQFCLERDIDIEDGLATIVEVNVDRTERPAGVSDVVGLALSRALRIHTRFLRSWTDDRLEVHSDVNLGIAVALEDGVIVPVLHQADTLTLTEFAASRRTLQAKARNGKLAYSETSGAVFTISNLGLMGVDRFRALVNPPESGILALGRTRINDGRRIITLTLSADHRVVDGRDGALLLEEIARLLGPSRDELTR